MSMLTPQEVSERAFAKASFGGYNMAMVDEFLDALTEDYTALYKENTALKAKMKVLVDKLEEYRSTEDAMRKTLLTAQTMADEMLREAEKKQAQMLTNAENEARERIGDIRQEISNEETRLTAARNATAVYANKLRELHRRELDYLDSLDTLSSPPPAPQPRRDEQVVAAVAEIEASMNRMLVDEEEPVSPPPIEEEAEPAPHAFENPFTQLREEEDTLSFDRPTPSAQPQQAEDPTRRMDMDDLRFGREFEL